MATREGVGNEGGSGHVRWHFDAAASIGVITLSRPSHSNALTPANLCELRDALLCLNKINVESIQDESKGKGQWNDGKGREVKCVLLRGEGKNFCAGIDLLHAARIFGIDISSGQISQESHCIGREREQLLWRIEQMQECISTIERVSYPVIAMVHGACYGLGLDIICACDIVLCTKSARFCLKEVDMAITADMGSLQRLPQLVGLARARMLAMTCKIFTGDDAEKMGLALSSFRTLEELQTEARSTAVSLAIKPSIAMRGTKRILNSARRGQTSDSLEQNALLNSSVMISEQLRNKLEAIKPKL